MKTNINGNSGSVKQSTKKKQCNANEKFRRSNDASVWGAFIMVRSHQRTDHKAGSATRRRRWTAERVRASRSRPHPMRRRPRAAADTARYIAVSSTMPALRGPASSSHQVILSTICLSPSLFKILLEIYYKVEICLININTVVLLFTR